MPSLRRVGNALSNTGDMLLQHVLRLRAQQEESSLVAKRQQELAEQQNAFRAAQAEDARRQQSLQQVLGDDSGLVAQRLAGAGEQWARDYVPSGHQAASKIGAKIGGMKREELPTDVGLEESLRSAPGGEDYAKDPRAVKYLIDQKGARQAMLAQNAATEATEAGAKSEAMGYGQMKGTNTAKNENAPIEQANAVAKEKALNPVLISRAAGEASVRQAAETKGAADRERQSWELAAQNPVIAGMAEQVIAGTPLKDVPAAHRGYVMAALRSTKYAPASRQKAKEILDIGFTSLQRMKGNPEGLEGFTGNVLGDLGQRNPFTGTPYGGSPAADFMSNFDQFKAASALDKIDFIRGMGHMSDADMKIINQAGTHLQQLMGTPAFASGMAEVEAAMLRAYQRMGVEPPMGAFQNTPAQSADQKWNMLNPTTRPR